MARSLVHELQRSSQLSGDVAAAAIQIMNMKASRPSWIQISQGRHLNAFEGPVASRKYIRAMNASTPYRRGQNPKKPKDYWCTYASYIPCNFVGYMAVSTVAITYGCSHLRCNSYYNESEENLNKANIPHPRESTRGWLVSWVCEYGHDDDF